MLLDVATGWFYSLDFAAERWRFQFSIIASYLTAFFVTTGGRSSSVASSLFSSAARTFNDPTPADTVGRFVEGDLMVATVAAVASRATATNPVIVRCFVIGTSSPPNPIGMGHGGFAKVQQGEQ